MRLAPCRILLLLFLHYTWLISNEILLLLHVASTWRHLVFAGFTLHLPYRTLSPLHVQCMGIAQCRILILMFFHCMLLPSKGILLLLLLHCMCIANCEILLLLVKYYMLLTLCYLKNTCSAVHKLHVADTLQNIFLHCM